MRVWACACVCVGWGSGGARGHACNKYNYFCYISVICCLLASAIHNTNDVCESHFVAVVTSFIVCVCVFFVCLFVFL